MTKILFLGALYGGGRERRFAQLLKGMDGNPDYEIYVVATSARYEYIHPGEINARFYALKSHDRKKDILDGLTEVISDFRPDIVQTWESEPRYLYTLLWLKMRYHFKLISAFVSDAIPSPAFSAGDIMKQAAYLTSVAIISNSMAGLIAKRAPMSKSHVIYNGFDFSRFTKDLDKDAKRKELGVEGKFVVTMCARFMPSKDWESYLKVAKSIGDKYPDVIFLSAGEGPTFDSVKAQSEAMGCKNVKFLGRRNDVEEILQVSNVGMLFTNNAVHAEGVSNFILEAMAAGVPVIATDGGGTPEIISSGVDGYVIPPFDAAKGTECLCALIEDKALLTQMSQAAVEKIKTQFSLTKIVDEYIAIYDKIAKKK